MELSSNMEGRAQRRRGGEKEREEECIASSDTNQMTCSTEEDLRAISKWMNELKQTITDDVRTAETTKTYVNQKTEEIMQWMTQMQNKMQKIQNKLIKEGRSAGLQSAVNALKEKIRSTPTYASVARSSKQVQRTTSNAPKKHVLLVQSNNKEKTSKEIKNELVNKINPKTDKIKIKGIRQTRANSIIMEFDTRSDLQKFKDHPKLSSFKIEEPKKRNPLMIIYDVDSSLTVNELKDSIIQQNLDELSIEGEDIIIPRFKTGPRDKPTVHWVIQTDPRMRKHIVL
ncbi:hypothetical protein HN011_003134 [Eciton burchellii]|nr:hypothetical protein HN011_003134 [Eciton burchellii]